MNLLLYPINSQGHYWVYLVWIYILTAFRGCKLYCSILIVSETFSYFEKQYWGIAMPVVYCCIYNIIIFYCKKIYMLRNTKSGLVHVPLFFVAMKCLFWKCSTNLYLSTGKPSLPSAGLWVLFCLFLFFGSLLNHSFLHCTTSISRLFHSLTKANTFNVVFYFNIT